MQDHWLRGEPPYGGDAEAWKISSDKSRLSVRAFFSPSPILCSSGNFFSQPHVIKFAKSKSSPDARCWRAGGPVDVWGTAASVRTGTDSDRRSLNPLQAHRRFQIPQQSGPGGTYLAVMWLRMTPCFMGPGSLWRLGGARGHWLWRAGSHREGGLPGDSACLEVQFLQAYGEWTGDADL